MIRSASRHTILCSLLLSVCLTPAWSQPISRRQALAAVGGCAAFLLGGDRLAANELVHTWPVDPAQDFTRLGLESFGLGVRSLLVAKGIASYEEAESLRWKLQATLWKHLPARGRAKVAIALPGGQYLHLAPHFEIDLAGDQSIRRIAYVGDRLDPSLISYRIRPRRDAEAYLITP